MQPIKPFTITIKGEHDEQGGCYMYMDVDGNFRGQDLFQILEGMMDCFEKMSSLPPKELTCIMLYAWIKDDKTRTHNTFMYDMKEAKKQSEAAEGGSL